MCLAKRCDREPRRNREQVFKARKFHNQIFLTKEKDRVKKREREAARRLLQPFSQEVARTPELAAYELEVGGEEEEAKGDINTMCAIQGMKMAWAFLIYHSHPKGPKQKQSPSFKNNLFCLYANDPCIVKMQLKCDDKCNILSPLHEMQIANYKCSLS